MIDKTCPFEKESTATDAVTLLINKSVEESLKYKSEPEEESTKGEWGPVPNSPPRNENHDPDEY